MSASSQREAALTALTAVLRAALPAANIRRNAKLGLEVPEGGLLILRDGEMGEPVDVTLNPVTYLWEHIALLEVLVQGPEPKDDQPDPRDAALDQLLLAVDGALAADPTLGGLVDRAEPRSAELSNLAIDGAPGLKGAVVPVALTYVTSSALG